MVRANYYFRILTALTATVAAAVLAALLIASAPASAQGDCSWVAWTDPYDQQTGVYLGTIVYADLGGVPMDPNTVNSDTFTLTNTSSSTTVLATVTYYGDYYWTEGGFQYFASQAYLDPNVDLDASTTYTATLKGGEGGVKDAS